MIALFYLFNLVFHYICSYKGNTQTNRTSHKWIDNKNFIR